jgi:alginate O-acetyltransferase complex protein AlgJ
MEKSSTTSTLKCWTNKVLIVLFALLLWLPVLDVYLHLDWTAPRSENRAMATYPKLQPGWHGLQDYVAGLEAYFNDHFGCRKCLVQWHNKVRWFLFNDRYTRSVLVGKDGWLFTSEFQMVEHYSGQIQFTPEQLQDWKELLEKRRDWLARRGIAYVFVVTPDKQTSYPEYLPSWVKKVRAETTLDQFFDYMRTNSTVPVLDLRNVVRAAKTIGPTYLKTDTHWNLWGGFVAYQELVRTLARQVPALKLEPLPITAFTLTNCLQPGGDLARMLGSSMAESNAYFLIPKPELPKFTTKQPTLEHYRDPGFINNSQAQGRLIIFHDSFAGCWTPFLGYHFNQITTRWQYDLDPTCIELDKPDIVVTEMLERFFNIEDPKKMMDKEALK